VIIAAAAANPMTVLRIVLTPLLLEKPQPCGGNSAVPGAFAACGARCQGQKAALDPTEPFPVARIFICLAITGQAI
jgi:hypothetical protein